MQTQETYTSATTRRGPARRLLPASPNRSCKRLSGMLIVYVVALFDIASAMTPAHAALHTDPPTGMRQCFRKFSGNDEPKKSITAQAIVENALTRAGIRPGRYFGSE
jgi:hypothetical protein